MENQNDSESGCSQLETPIPLQDQTRESKEVFALDDHALDDPTLAGPAADESVVPGQDDYEYLTGFKLVLVMSTVTMVVFLILLDSTIIATVCHKS